MAKFGEIIVVVKAILTRIIFATHGFIAIWRATSIKSDPYYWYLSASILALCFEGVFTLTIKKNQEWKWFCPSVFFYLCSVVPAIWLIEVDKFDHRMQNLTRMNSNNSMTTTTTMRPPNFRPGKKGYPPPPHTVTTLAPTSPSGPMQPISFQGVDLPVPIDLDEEMWATVIEQLLMLILIIGRWMLPKGGLTRDQLSQLLLVYIGTAADIIEFFDSFKDEKIAQNRVLCLLILSIWSWSLLQFTVVLTATKARRTRMCVEQVVETPKAKLKNGIIKVKEVCCSIDVWAILINIILQDAPFLIFRMLLITYYKIVSYMNIFFTCKNTLVIILQFYRLFVVQMEKKKEIAKSQKANVSGNLVKAIGQAAFLGRQAEARRAAGGKSSSRRAGSAGPSSRREMSKKHRSQESISSRNTRCSDAPTKSERVKGRRKSLSTGNLRSSNNRTTDEDYLEEEIFAHDIEAGVSGSNVSGTNDGDSQDASEDAPMDDVSLASERPRVQRKNIRLSENPGVYRISGSRSSAASSDRGQGHYRQDTGYSSSSKESGNSSRRDRVVHHGGGSRRTGGGGGSRSRSSAQRRRHFVNSRHVESQEFTELDLENQILNRLNDENERI